MSERIMIEVSDQALQRAGLIAAQTHQRVEEVISSLVEATIPEPPVEILSDDEVLALAKSKFSPEQQERFSYLLEQNREGVITLPERAELDQLMDVYERGMLRKAQALSEAVSRGLMELPKP